MPTRFWAAGMAEPQPLEALRELRWLVATGAGARALLRPARWPTCPAAPGFRSLVSGGATPPQPRVRGPQAPVCQAGMVVMRAPGALDARLKPLRPGLPRRCRRTQGRRRAQARWARLRPQRWRCGCCTRWWRARRPRTRPAARCCRCRARAASWPRPPACRTSRRRGPPRRAAAGPGLRAAQGPGSPAAPCSTCKRRPATGLVPQHSTAAWRAFLHSIRPAAGRHVGGACAALRMEAVERRCAWAPSRMAPRADLLD